VDTRTEEPVAERRYVTVAIVLAALIATQLGLFYGRDAGLRRDLALYGILGAAVLQVVVAGSLFMHLRTGHRYYRQIFVNGVVLALVVFAAAMFILLAARPSV
jgi:heme/copper-type cytochrome/quinol oxidase subunit 4